MAPGPVAGDLTEITVDVVGLADDAVLGSACDERYRQMGGRERGPVGAAGSRLASHTRRQRAAGSRGAPGTGSCA